MHARWPLAIVAITGVTVLTACSGGTVTATGADAPPSTPMASASSRPASDPGHRKVARPGSTYRLHQATVLAFRYGATEGTIAIKINSITRGRPADLAPLKLGNKVAEVYPYFIRYTVKNMGHTDLSFIAPDRIVGTLSDGSEARSIDVTDRYRKCPAHTAPGGFTHGKVFRSCVLMVAPGRTPVVGAKYWGAPYSLSDHEAVSWRGPRPTTRHTHTPATG